MNMAPVNVRFNAYGVIGCVFALLCMWWYLFGLPFSTREEERISMKELLSVSIELAKRGGDKVRSVRDSDVLGQSVKGETNEGAKEMLTKGDIGSHRAISYGLLKTYPGLMVISEEHDTEPINLDQVESVDKHLKEVQKLIQSDQQIPASHITVWIDPLDATQEYTENLTKFVTTMVCVAVKGEPTIGVIHFPFKKETVWAWAGYGHSENLKKSPPKENNDNKPPTKIIVSRSHKGHEVQDILLSSFGKDTQIEEAGGAGYKTVEVINGQADAYVHKTVIKKWDICAGNAILSALESKMTDLNGNTIDYSASGNNVNKNGILATLYNHNDYLTKLKAALEEAKKKENLKKDSMSR